MAGMRKTDRMKKGPGISGTSRGERSEAQGKESPAKLQVKSVK